MLHACGGDENTRPGFDNWRQPVGQTESVANRLPEGRAKRVNPPLTAIFEKELVRKYGLFFRMLHACGGDENTRPGFDNWRQPVGQMTSLRGICPHKNAGSVFEQRLRWPRRGEARGWA